MKSGALLLLALLVGALPLPAQQQLGHKVLGGIGIDAGTQAEPGFYLLDRFAYFQVDAVVDRQGNEIFIPGLDASAYANVFGVAYTAKPRNLPYLSVAAGVPLARISVNADLPPLSLDQSGFGDLFVQPIKVGVRLPRFDLVTLYTFYAPTGKYEPRRGSVGRGFWTHQFSAGGAAYFNRERTSRASMLASYDINRKKRDIDITRGNTFQLQGGAGIGVLRVATLGFAGYALWQVTDDHGADVPPSLRGRRSRVFALGPELAFVVPALRSRFNARWENDFGTRARIEGNILVLSVSIQAWRPALPGPDVLGR